MSTFTGDSRLGTELMYPNRKPVGKVKIDDGHPLAPDWGYWLTGISNKNLAGSTHLLGSSLNDQQKGGDLQFDGSTGVVRLNTIDKITREFTFIADVTLHSNTQDHALLDVNDQIFVFWADTEGTTLRLASFAGLPVNYGISNKVPINKRVQLACVVNGVNDTASMYINGLLTKSGAIGSGLFEDQPASTIAIGSRYASTDKEMDGLYHSAYVISRRLTPEEISSLHRNPYQFLLPDIGA